MILPNFLVIGAQKAGTTALTKFLRQHADVSTTLKIFRALSFCNYK